MKSAAHEVRPPATVVPGIAVPRIRCRTTDDKHEPHFWSTEQYGREQRSAPRRYCDGHRYVAK